MEGFATVPLRRQIMMKTKQNLLQTCLLAAALLALPAVVQAQFIYITTNGTITITGYTGPGGAGTIPATINGLPVTKIGDYAFSLYPYPSSTGLTSVTIPNSVISIGDYAFASCYSLTNVTIGSSVTSIGDSAFYFCYHLTSVTIPNSVTGIGDYAFDACQSLTSFTIGNGVTSIGDDAFAGCEDLTSVTIPDSVTNIGDRTFYDCPSLTSLTIGNGVTSIGNHAFDGCWRLTSVTIPNSVTSIGDYAFDGWESLTSLTIPNSVTSIGYYVFDDCESLTAITVDALNPAYSSMSGVLFDKAQTTLIQYPQGKAGSCYTIPNSVTNIGDYAFDDCGSLTSVTIGNGVTSIGYFAFSGCGSLTSVFFTGDAPVAVAAFGSGAWPPRLDHATIYYLSGTTGWSEAFDGLPTALWFLPQPLILNQGPGFGVQSNQFGFTISWATNVSVVVEAATNLANPVWLPVSTNTLTGGTSYFSDPQPANLPGRFYRLRSP